MKHYHEVNKYAYIPTQGVANDTCNIYGAFFQYNIPIILTFDAEVLRLYHNMRRIYNKVPSLCLWFFGNYMHRPSTVFTQLCLVSIFLTGSKQGPATILSLIKFCCYTYQLYQYSFLFLVICQYINIHLAQIFRTFKIRLKNKCTRDFFTWLGVSAIYLLPVTVNGWPDFAASSINLVPVKKKFLQLR